MNKVIAHFKKICKHKSLVAKHCFYCGLYWQGIVHDLSKFTPSEFIESVKYYQSDHSPIDEAKKDKGFSEAWMHHKSRNKHHYEYWQDEFDKGTKHIKMPFKYVLEYVCDSLAASKTYFGDSFTYDKYLEWWNHSTRDGMNIESKRCVGNIIKKICEYKSEKRILSDRNYISMIKRLYETNYFADVEVKR